MRDLLFSLHVYLFRLQVDRFDLTYSYQQRTDFKRICLDNQIFDRFVLILGNDVNDFFGSGGG